MSIARDAATGRDLIVVGASAGGVEALTTMAAHLPEDFPAAVCVVLHTPPDGQGWLAQILDRAGPLPAKMAEDGEEIRPGHLYIAPPDHHLLVRPGSLLVVRGPRENRSRPAIDPLFRSAAVAYRSRVVGVVLSGMLDDGTAGLYAVKKCGGVAVVQSAEDAAYPQMPQNALDHVDTDYVVPVAELGALLSRLAQEQAPPPPPIPDSFALEVRAVERYPAGLPAVEVPEAEVVGRHSTISCPDCGGHLREISDGAPLRFRCHLGHSYTASTLLAQQDEAVEEALWVALRVLEERARMLLTLARAESARGRERTATGFEERAEESRAYADRIRALLTRTPSD